MTLATKGSDHKTPIHFIRESEHAAQVMPPSSLASVCACSMSFKRAPAAWRSNVCTGIGGQRSGVRGTQHIRARSLFLKIEVQSTVLVQHTFEAAEVHLKYKSWVPFLGRPPLMHQQQPARWQPCQMA